jgi:hypothetical protein
MTKRFTASFPFSGSSTSGYKERDQLQTSSYISGNTGEYPTKP